MQIFRLSENGIFIAKKDFFFMKKKNYKNTYLGLSQRKADTKETLNFCPKSWVNPFGKMEFFRLCENDVFKV